MATKKRRLQKILNDAGMKHIRVVDEDNVLTKVDGELEAFNRSDKYSGHPLSGWANFGCVGGDHRMIAAIAEDITYVFSILK